jgi:hypothetical protein
LKNGFGKGLGRSGFEPLIRTEHGFTEFHRVA